MSRAGRRVGAGGEQARRPRAWRADRSGSSVVIEAWTPWRWKLVLLLFGGFTLWPAVLLWDAVRGFRISDWVLATTYSLIAIACVGAVLRGVGRERVRVSPHEIVVERFVFFMWTFTRISTPDGVTVLARDGWIADVGSALVFGASERVVVFGRWIGAAAARAIAEQLREMVSAPQDVGREPNGVVCSVARYEDAHTTPGSEDVVDLEGRHPCVIEGHLRWGIPTLPWSTVALLAFFALLLLRGVQDVAMWVSLVVVPLVIGAPVICRGGVIDRIARRRAHRARMASPREPWRAVPAWTGDVLQRSRGARMLGSGLTFAGLSAAAAWMVFRDAGRVSLAGQLVAAALGLAALFALYRMQNVFFQGLTEVRLRELPYRCPGEVVIDFAVGRRGAVFHDVAFTLRRMVQVDRTAQAPVLGYSHVGVYVLPDDQPAPGPGEQVTARFSIPRGAGGTSLARPRPVFWELLVEGPTSCGWYSETFPIPIYDVEPDATT
jgi:hypothetical protein